MDEKRYERTSSAEVSINAKGNVSFNVKVYFDVEERTSSEVADMVEGIMSELRKRFR